MIIIQNGDNHDNAVVFAFIQSPGLFADYAFLFIGVFGGISQGVQDHPVAYNHTITLAFSLSLSYRSPGSVNSVIRWESGLHYRRVCYIGQF